MKTANEVKLLNILQCMKTTNEVKLLHILQVALGLVVGRASAVIWPPSRWKKLYANLDN